MATIQLHDSNLGWLDAAQLKFISSGQVKIEYDIDYAQQHWGRKDLFALSVTNPVSLDISCGELPGYIVDLVPQGQVLKRLLAQYRVAKENDFQKILETIPLASPGNLRIKEPWLEVEEQRANYSHPGFSKQEIVSAHVDFVQYMMDHGSPVAGTSGAAGGAPKFLLREDANGRFHADGYLDDSKTKKAWLVKFPFTDSYNSKTILKTEWAYSKLLADVGIDSLGALEWIDDVLFIPRFDRVLDAKGCLHYLGLESFYAAHKISQFGVRLKHEDNLRLICCYSTEPLLDVVEYLKRDLMNQALANSDNHGRNFSFLKKEGSVRLSPVYDVTAMKYFQGDLIVPLTTWEETGKGLADKVDWIEANLELSKVLIRESLKDFYALYSKFESEIQSYMIPQDILEKTRSDRMAAEVMMKKL